MTRPQSRSSRTGFALLEVLVALIVLALVGLADLELFHQSHRITGDAREWSDAVAYAADAIEQAKLGGLRLEGPPIALPGGFRRQFTRHPWRDGLDLVTVTVDLPDGGHFELSRLVKPRAPGTSARVDEW